MVNVDVLPKGKRRLRSSKIYMIFTANICGHDHRSTSDQMPKRSATSAVAVASKRSTADVDLPTAIPVSEIAADVDLPTAIPDSEVAAKHDDHTPESSPPSPASCTRPAPRVEQHSPSNRDKFLAGLYVQTVGCCLDACTAGPNVRLTFKGTVAVLYPVNFNPDRRYVVFMDETGNTGITIWNANLRKLATDSIGKMCEISRVTLSAHAGKKVLNLSKDSEVR